MNESTSNLIKEFSVTPLEIAQESKLMLAHVNIYLAAPEWKGSIVFENELTTAVERIAYSRKVDRLKNLSKIAGQLNEEQGHFLTQGLIS